MRLAKPADPRGSRAAGRCPEALQGLRARWLRPTSTCWCFGGGCWRQNPAAPRPAALCSRLLPQHKHDWEYFRTVRARKTNPGAQTKSTQKLTFMSHPETTCSWSHLRACHSVGGAGLLCWGIQPAGSFGGRPGRAPLRLPDVAPRLQSNPCGCPGVPGAPVPPSLQSPGRQLGATAHHCSATLGASPNLSVPSGV